MCDIVNEPELERGPNGLIELQHDRAVQRDLAGKVARGHRFELGRCCVRDGERVFAECDASKPVG